MGDPFLTPFDPFQNQAPSQVEAESPEDNGKRVSEQHTPGESVRRTRKVAVRV